MLSQEVKERALFAERLLVAGSAYNALLERVLGWYYPVDVGHWKQDGPDALIMKVALGYRNRMGHVERECRVVFAPESTKVISTDFE